jgi:hypothetical protein
MDAKTTFLNKDLKDEVYMTQPKTFYKIIVRKLAN